MYRKLIAMFLTACLCFAVSLPTASAVTSTTELDTQVDHIELGLEHLPEFDINSVPPEIIEIILENNINLDELIGILVLEAEPGIDPYSSLTDSNSINAAGLGFITANWMSPYSVSVSVLNVGPGTLYNINIHCVMIGPTGPVLDTWRPCGDLGALWSFTEYFYSVAQLPATSCGITVTADGMVPQLKTIYY